MKTPQQTSLNGAIKNLLTGATPRPVARGHDLRIRDDETPLIPYSPYPDTTGSPPHSGSHLSRYRGWPPATCFATPPQRVSFSAIHAANLHTAPCVWSGQIPPPLRGFVC